MGGVHAWLCDQLLHTLKRPHLRRLFTLLRVALTLLLDGLDLLSQVSQRARVGGDLRLEVPPHALLRGWVTRNTKVGPRPVSTAWARQATNLPRDDVCCSLRSVTGAGQPLDENVSLAVCVL